jgi:hypothetical protein
MVGYALERVHRLAFGLSNLQTDGNGSIVPNISTIYPSPELKKRLTSQPVMIPV